MTRKILIAMALASFVLAGIADDDAGFVRITPDELVWETLAPGLSVAVLEGNPSANEFYIIRAKFAPGTFSEPHYHPNDRYITVIQGTWWTGTGPVMDKDGSVPLGPGSYMKHPAGAPHFDGSIDEEVIVEIRGIGPAPLVYVDEQGQPIE